tara:strand:- start:165387 stop:165944 length:558 start_codon:yes stop_codon:yes gene_type:complete
MVQENPEVSWERLTQSLAFYKKQGFQYREMPWVVSTEATKATFPQRDETCATYWGDLIGSSEQSFIQELIDKSLPKGRYCALTPCFRLEHTINHISRPYFMKVELFQSIDVNEDALHKTVDLCLNWFKELAPENSYEVIATEDGYDINANGIEIGSYGIRTYKNFKWIYATGIAEPRFGVAFMER